MRSAFIGVVAMFLCGCGSISVSTPEKVPDEGITFKPSNDAVVPAMAVQATIDLSKIDNLPVKYQTKRPVWLLFNTEKKAAE